MRTFKFSSGNEWTGVPIMSSNMDGVGTFSMAKVLQDLKMLTGLLANIITRMTGKKQ